MDVKCLEWGLAQHASVQMELLGVVSPGYYEPSPQHHAACIQIPSPSLISSVTSGTWFNLSVLQFSIGKMKMVTVRRALGCHEV